MYILGMSTSCRFQSIVTMPVDCSRRLSQSSFLVVSVEETERSSLSASDWDIQFFSTVLLIEACVSNASISVGGKNVIGISVGVDKELGMFQWRILVLVRFRTEISFLAIGTYLLIAVICCQ